MRATAGDTSGLYDVDGISRTTTTSLLLNDAVMRAARKVARNRNINIAANDLGAVSYTHLRAHETRHDLVCRLLLE